ncbi:MAG TPA: hypothetical protein QKA14_01195 [Candidatus Megaira endosymbiont of Hartmannula sinica]|nr:hypothetical protein [Candidatus Megaera endosymbiont of Hartmannula sinica]
MVEVVWRFGLDKNQEIDQIEITSDNKELQKNNIYVGKIVRIEPALQACFVEYTNEKIGFLPFNEINPIYYNIETNEIPDSLNSLNNLDVTNEEVKKLIKKYQNVNSDILTEEKHNNSSEVINNKYDVNLDDVNQDNHQKIMARIPNLVIKIAKFRIS